MVKTLLSTTPSDTDTNITTAGATQYYWLGHATIFQSTLEINREITYQTAGTVSKLYVRILANTCSASSTIKVRKNQADSGMGVTIGAGVTGEFEDTVNTVSVTAGDELDYQVISGGTGTMTLGIMSVIFDATTDCVTRHITKGYGVATASVTHYVSFAGDFSGTTATEANAENSLKTAGTIKNVRIRVSDNTRTTDTIFTLRKNRANTAITFTYTNAEIGTKEDTSNNITVAVDDELDWAVTTSTGVGTISFQSIAADFVTTTTLGVLTNGSVGTTADMTMGEPLTWYFPIGGGYKQSGTTEANAQQKARTVFTFKNLVIRVGTNTVNADSTFNLRVNGADVISVTIPTTGTGVFSNTTTSFMVAAGDLINYSIVTPAVTGTQSIVIRQMSITTDRLVLIANSAILKYNILQRVSRPSALLITCGATVNTTAGATQYWSIAGVLGRTTTESDKQIPFKHAGTFSKLYVKVTTNNTSADSTVRLRINGSNGNLSLTIPAGQTGVFEDIQHSDTISSGDLITIQTVSGGTGLFGVATLSIYFETTALTETVSKLVTNAASSVAVFALASISRYNHLAGSISAGITGDNGAQDRIDKPGTIKNLVVYVAANARTTDVIIKSRKNGADGNLIVTIPAGQTGRFEDTTHTDTVTTGDLVNTVLVTSTGTEDISLWSIVVDYIVDATGTSQPFSLLNVAGSGLIINPGVTNYFALNGPIVTGATEDDRKVKARQNLILSQAAVLILANTITANSTLRLKKNGSNGNILITVPASTSGVFTDLVNGDMIGPEDEINWEFITGGTGTTLQVRGIQLNAFNPSSNQIITKYNIFQSVAQSIILKYNIVGRIVNNVILKYNLVARVLQSLILKYNIIGRVVQGVILKYNIVGRTVQSLILKYNMIGRVVQNTILKYNIVGRVTQSVILKYNIIQHIIQNLILKYHITEHITNAIDLKYHLFERISNSVIAEYDIAGRITNSVIVSYNLVGRIARSLIIRYNLRVRIANSVIFKYNLLERITNNVIPKYNIVERVDNALSIAYKIAGRTTKNLIARYHVRGRVTSTLDIKYNIIERIFQSLILAYDIAEPVYARVINQLDLAYNIFVRTQNQMTLRYNIVGRVVEVLAIKFNQRGRMPRNPDLKSAFSRFPAKTIRDMFRL